MIKPRIFYYLIAIAITAVIWRVASADAKGEFYREVPRWWVGPALCVHSHEGSWRDPNPPYYGGMQMDLGFARHYGGWILAHSGTPDRWAPNTQLLVAYRGWRKRGWYPWPNTARACGLL